MAHADGMRLNVADVCEAVADRQPDAPALVHGDRTTSWTDLVRRAGAVGSALIVAGLPHQGRVAVQGEGPEQLEAMLGAITAALVPVTTDPGCTADGQVRLWRDTEVEAVVFDGRSTDRWAAERFELPAVRVWIRVDDGSGPCPRWAWPYEQVVDGPVADVRPWPRSDADLCLIQVGGGDARPGGVVWTQHDLVRRLSGGDATPGPRVVLDGRVGRGDAGLVALSALVHGGCVVTRPGAQAGVVRHRSALRAGGT